MSDQNPPQYPSYPGDQPQPPAYGAQPVPPQGYGYPPAQNYGPPAPYAGWWSRVGASLLDGLVTAAVVIIPVILGAVLAFAGSSTDPVTNETTDVNPLGIVIMVCAYLGAFVFAIWNQGVRMGRTGQSLGKKWVGIQVVRTDNGQFLGGGTGFLRLILATIFGNLCFINYLWPLWDERKQTWHDKVVSSVVVTK